MTVRWQSSNPVFRVFFAWIVSLHFLFKAAYLTHPSAPASALLHAAVWQMSHSALQRRCFLLVIKE